MDKHNVHALAVKPVGIKIIEYTTLYIIQLLSSLDLEFEFTFKIRHSDRSLLI